jgi:uncharacterized membrane protein YczE
MSEKTRRVIMTVCGVLIAGFSVGMFNFSAFGMDPFQVFAHGLWNLVPMGYGTFYTILNLTLLIVIFVVDRRKIGLGTVINMFLLGYVVEFSSWLFQTWIPDPAVWLKAVFLAAGIVIMCFGSALYFTGDLGVSTYDAVALIMAEKKFGRYQYLRIGSDFVCTIIGALLGATAGIGTVVTAFFMGPIIVFFNRTVAVPLRYGKNKSCMNQQQGTVTQASDNSESVIKNRHY